KPMQLEAVSCIVCGSLDSTEEARSFDFLYHSSDQAFWFVRCSGCGHVYLNPRPAASEVSTMYPATYPSFTGKFSKKHSPISFVKSYILRRRLAPLKSVLERGGRVLDVGCGDGQLLIDIKHRYPQVEAFGLDWNFSEPVRDRLTAKNVHLYCSLVEQADLPASSFDLVIMNQLIEHLWDPRTALNSIRTCLKPNGLLTIETPNPDGYDRRFFREGTWGAFYTPRHLNLFTQTNLVRFLSTNGFDVVQHTSLCAPITWVYSIQSSIEKKYPRLRVAASFIRDTNVIALIPFTLLDTVVKCLGGTTSNQKVFARRRP
ncbi:MAG: class I SAM-dependent methyltransferase, partial [Candidatus Brocadiia bacterium]